MAEVDGVVVSLDEQNWTFHKGPNVTGYPENTDLKVRLAGPIVEIRTLPGLKAPSVITIPSISGNTTVGSILSRTAGLASGDPVPSRTTLWLRNNIVIEGMNGDTLDTSEFEVGDIITTRDVWTNVINGEDQVALGTSSQWILSETPTITASPITLTAGQQATIQFNTAPDTVTVAQGNTTLTATRVGNTNDWTFTPLTSDPVSIGATKAGWVAYSATITPASAPAAFAKTSNERMVFLGVTESTPAITYTSTSPDEWDGDYTIPSLTVLSTGPAPVVPPRIKGTPAVGQKLDLDKGLIASLNQQEPSMAWEWPDGSVAESYVVRSQDQGTTVDLDVSLTDMQGTRVVTTNSLVVPASATITDGVTHLGKVDSVASASANVQSVTIPLGAADAAKKMALLIVMPAATSSAKIVAGGVEYPLTEIQEPSGIPSRISLYYGDCPAGGTGVLQVTTSGTTSSTPQVEVFATKNVTMFNSYSDVVTVTAGTAIQRNVGTTQVGDYIIYAIITAPFNADGVFSSPSGVAEIRDQPIRGGAPQLWVGFGVETVAGARMLAATPNASGSAARISTVFRRV